MNREVLVSFGGSCSVGGGLVEWSHLCGEVQWCQFQKRGTRECVGKRIFKVCHWCLLYTKQCAMCLVVQEILVVEEKQLLVEAQGGFRRGRGCRDQILSLSRLGQTMITRRRKGMLAAFIDFKKAYV